MASYARSEERTQATSERIAAGFGWGVVATLAMSVLMVIGVTTGFSPMPSPIPEAIASNILSGAPQPLILMLAVTSHLAYGGVWGSILASMTRPVTIWKGVGLGVLLWLLMQVTVLPFLGWGLFGAGVTPKIAGATLILHLIYGTILGWLMDRK